jgi:FMN phosphatase YigB (HAD superfamily)
MKIVLFDLGDTLEQEDPNTHKDTLLPGAIETLSSIKQMRDSNNQPVILGLVSDFGLAQNPGDQNEIKAKQEEYYGIIKNLGIRSFFEPVSERITLSIEVNAFKPDEKIFRAAVNRVSNGLSFDNVIFITEKREHVDAVRRYGMNAIHFRGPGQQSGDVEKLTDLIPKIEEFAMSHSNLQG